MHREILVSAGVIGALGDISFLKRIPGAHAIQRDSDRRGSEMNERRRGTFVSEHYIGGTEIHVREEYAFGDHRRFYIMTASERVRDTADFLNFDGLNFN